MATVEQQSQAGRNGGPHAAAIEVENPATGATIGHVPDMGADEVADLVARARVAQPGWEALGFEGRAKVMYAARRWIVENRDRMLRTIMEETGKTREDAIAALMAGNAVVLKPSDVTPLSNLLMAEGMRAAGLPDDVMPVATGCGQTGAALVDHADMIMFTGSTATGKKIMAQAAETLTPVSLELGGKDPMIVLRDADLERAANAAVAYAMANGGQVCTSVERVYVEEPVYDEFVSRVVENVRGLRQGEPGDGGSVDVGAVTFAPQVEIVESHVKDAVEKGAKVVVGGKRADGPGRFFEPTVLTGVDHTMKAMTEETFGPTLPIMKVSDVDEAVRLANDTVYGLNSSVWTKDVEKGERIARRVEAGNTCVNDGLVNFLAQEAPFAGNGDSGLGVRHSAQGIRKYCSVQTILITRFAPKRELHFYPYSARTTRLLEGGMALLYGRRKRK